MWLMNVIFVFCDVTTTLIYRYVINVIQEQYVNSQYNISVVVTDHLQYEFSPCDTFLSYFLWTIKVNKL